MAQPVGTKRLKPYQHYQADRMCAFPGCETIFTPMNPNQHYCRNVHYSCCCVCGREFKVHNLSDVPKTCSKSCWK